MNKNNTVDVWLVTRAEHGCTHVHATHRDPICTAFSEEEAIDICNRLNKRHEKRTEEAKDSTVEIHYEYFLLNNGKQFMNNLEKYNNKEDHALLDRSNVFCEHKCIHKK
jgi:hypothetical protein